jgi:hypothetical protein
MSRQPGKIYKALIDIDRRIIFLFIALAIIIPLLLAPEFPQFPAQMVLDTFDELDRLSPNAKILMAFDYDPASEPELQPMASAWLRHAFENDLRVYIMALWPIGQNMAEDSLNDILPEYPDKKYGIDYVNLGFKSGNQGVINVVLTDIRKMYPTDVKNRSLDDIPMMRGVQNLKDFELIVNISAGFPGLKEWVQFGADPSGVRIIGGSTAVQAPLMYPYLPNQLNGLLGGLKAAAEYEECLDRKLCAKTCDTDEACVEKCIADFRPRNKGKMRMSAQAIAHLVIMLFITIGNVTYFIERRRKRLGE